MLDVTLFGTTDVGIVPGKVAVLVTVVVLGRGEKSNDASREVGEAIPPDNKVKEGSAVTVVAAALR